MVTWEYDSGRMVTSCETGEVMDHVGDMPRTFAENRCGYIRHTLHGKTAFNKSSELFIFLIIWNSGVVQD